MSPSSDELKCAVGRYGKVLVPGHGSFIYGKVVDVDGTGNYFKFRRSGRFKDQWHHRETLTLHPLDKEGSVN